MERRVRLEAIALAIALGFVAVPAVNASPVAADGISAAVSAGAPEVDVPTDESKNADPASVVDEVEMGRRKPRRVVSVENTDVGPQVNVTRVANRRQAVTAVDRLQDDPDVASIAVDTPVAAMTDYTSSQWGLSSLGAPGVWSRSTGAGVVVAVVDTGVDAQHPDLAGRVLSGARFLDGSGGSSTGDGGTDDHGHGTHVAGIVAADRDGDLVTGIAPAASVLPVKVLDSNGSGWTSDVSAGIIWAAQQGADVINMSLGSSSQSSSISSAVAYAIQRNVAVFAAAGNGGASAPPSFPAADAGVVGVSAVDRNHAIASFSNRGSYVDLAAPGVSIVSSFPGGAVASMSGTSMATPFAAGSAALVLAALRAKSPSATGSQVVSSLTSTATDLGAAGADDSYGAGLVNPGAAIASLPAVPPPAQDPSPAPSPDPGGVAPPSAPTSVRVRADPSQLVVTFGPPASAGSSAVTGYQVKCRYRSRVLSYTGGASLRGVMWRRLANAKKYLCAVRATNGAWGPWSGSVGSSVRKRRK